MALGEADSAEGLSETCFAEFAIGIATHVRKDS